MGILRIKGPVEEEKTVEDTEKVYTERVEELIIKIKAK